MTRTLDSRAACICPTLTCAMTEVTPTWISTTCEREHQNNTTIQFKPDYSNHKCIYTSLIKTADLMAASPHIFNHRRWFCLGMKGFVGSWQTFAGINTDSLCPWRTLLGLTRLRSPVFLRHPASFRYRVSHYFTVVGDPGAADPPVFLKGDQPSTRGGAWALSDCAGTHHESQGTGVDVGVIHAAVDFICTVPVRGALVLVTEPPGLRCITAEERGRGWPLSSTSLKQKQSQWDPQVIRDDQPKRVNLRKAESMNTQYTSKRFYSWTRLIFFSACFSNRASCKFKKPPGACFWSTVMPKH